MKLTSPIFILLCALLFCSYSSVIPFSEADSETIKKIYSKLEGYEKLIPLINETLFRYCQLCEDINTTYSIRLENYFGEDSTQYEMLSDAYYQFKDEEDELIDEKVLPSLTTIKKDINNLYALMEETPDSEKNLDKYEISELQIRDSLRTTLQSIELHILKVAEILGLKNDLVFKIGEFLKIMHKSQFSLTISPKKYLESIRKLIEEIHEQIEEQLSTSSKLNPVKKLYITVFKNKTLEKSIDKIHLLWLIFAAIAVNTVSAYYVPAQTTQLPYKDQIGELWKNWKNPQNDILETAPILISEIDKKLLEGLSRSFLHEVKTLTEQHKYFNQDIKDFVQIWPKLNENKLQKIITNFKKIEKQIRKQLINYRTKLSDEKKQEPNNQELDQKIAGINKVLSIKQNSKNINNFLGLKDGQVYLDLLPSNENEASTVQLYLLKVKEALLLTKTYANYLSVVIGSLKAAKDPLEKLLFPNKQDRMEKLGMYHPYARPDSSERDGVQKIYAQLKKRAQVKPKVKAAQVIGWEKLEQELQGKIEYCTGDGPLRYRNTELLPLIIAGEPGTGKSFTAEAIADVCGRNLYKLTPDMFDIQTLNNFFNMVDSDTPAIVFFDEANLALDQNDRHAKLLQSYLLPRLTAPANKFRKIYVILATNQPDKLPGDIWRRCDTLWLGLPRMEEREKALKIYLEENGYMCDASFRKLFVNLTEDMNFDDLHIILDTIKRELIRSQQNYINEELFKKGLKSVYQHKLKSIAFDPKFSRTELLASFIKIPYTLFKKYIQEWKDMRRPISLEEIKNTIQKTGQTGTKRFYFF